MSTWRKERTTTTGKNACNQETMRKIIVVIIFIIAQVVLAKEHTSRRSMREYVNSIMNNVFMTAIIESSKSIDIGIYYGLSFLWNAESPRNLQQTKAG